MEWSAPNFLFLNAAVVTLLVLAFLLVRKGPKPPVTLELRDEDQIKAESAREAKALPPKPAPKFQDPRLPNNKPTPIGAGNYQPRVRKPQIELLEPDEGRALNVFFMWNGHSWDAYEVLGIPGGSTPEKARVAYERAAALADKETLPFLKAALDAVSKS